jgi:arylsulfatase A-like enzyme
MRLRTRALVLLPSLLAACGQAPARPAGPNLLLVTIDTLRADHLGTYGYERPTSPRLDAFAETAVVFDDAGVQASWTLPSLASLLTSLPSSTHSRLDDSFTTLAEILCAAGWDTAMVASHVFLGAQFGLHQGFVHFDDELVREMYQSDRSITSPEVTERGARYLREQAASPDAGPWFLWVHYFDPHAEYQVQAGFTERFGSEADVDRYDGEPRRVQEPVRAMDVLPTVLELLDVSVSGGAVARPADGQSLVPAMRGAPLPELPLLSELRLDERNRYDSLRLGRWKLIVDRNTETARLFDLENDPRELADLAAAEPERASALLAELERQLAAARAAALPYAAPGRAPLLPGERANLSDLGYGGEDEDH